MRLVIAGLTIEVRGQDEGLHILPDPADKSYLDFISTTDRNALDIAARVHVGVAPESALQPLVLEETSPSWFADGARRRVVSPKVAGDIFWECSFDHLVRTADVFLPASAVHDEAGIRSVKNPIVYPVDQFLVMYHLARRQGIILHAAGAFHEGRCALFLGRSGAGKSTVSRQLQTRTGFRLGSDDRIIVRKLGTAHTAFGTPWPGEAKLARNESAPVGGLFFLHKAAENRIAPLKPQTAFERLLPVASIPWFDAEVFPVALDYLATLAAEVPAFDLHFKPTPEVADDIDRLLRSVHGSS